MKLFETGYLGFTFFYLSYHLQATDTEALGLLRWLATSHAAEDINSDDELVCESILTPLLPATTIDKVLEKASIDYESESHKECQDILDSVEDLIDFEGLKDRTYNSLDQTQVSSGKTIPQIDGSSDDLSLSPSAGSVAYSSKRDIKTESKKSSQDSDKTFSIKRKRKKSLWGSLPLSVTEKGKDNLDSVGFNITEACADEIKEYLGKSFPAENNLGKTSNPLNVNIDANDCNKTEASTLVECSVRDLMRKKRSRRIESADCGFVGSESVHLKGEKEAPIFFCPKQLDFHELHGEPDKKAPGSLNHRPSITNVQEELHEAVGFKPTHSDPTDCILPRISGVCNPPQAYTGNPEQMGKVSTVKHYPEKHDSAISISPCETYKSKKFDFLAASVEPVTPDADTLQSHKEIVSPDERMQQTGTSGSWCLSASSCKHEVLGMDGYILKDYNASGTSLSTDKLVLMDAMTDKKDLQNEDCGGGPGGQHGHQTGLAVDYEEKPLELVGMTFCKRPPAADWNEGTTANVSHTHTTRYWPPVFSEGNYQVASGEFCISLKSFTVTFNYILSLVKTTSP